MSETTHCTVELYNAMKGECPVMYGHYEQEDYEQNRDLCTFEFATSGAMAFFLFKLHDEHKVTVNCTVCLKLMLEAMDPVRRDYLPERGIIEELKKVT